MAKSIKDLSQRKFILLTDELYNSLKNQEKAKQLTESSEFQAVKNLDNDIGKLLNDQSIPPDKKAHLYSLALKNFQTFKSRAPELQKQKDVVPATQPVATKPPAARSVSDIFIDDDELENPEFQLSDPADYHKLTFDSREQSPEPTEQDHAPKAQTPEPAEKEQSPVVGAVSSPQADSTSAQRQERYAGLKQQVQSADKDVISYDPNTRELILYGHRIPSTNYDSIVNFVSNHRPSESQKPTGVGLFLETYGSANLNLDYIANKKLREIAEAAAPKGYGKHSKVIRWVQVL